MGKLARHRRKRSNPAAEKGISDVVTDVAAGAAGYAVTRLVARIVYSRVPARFAKHAHVAASALGAVGVYFGTRYVEQAQPYHEMATVGAGIALVQSAFQTYAPAQFAYITADVSPELAADLKKSKVAPVVEAVTINPDEYVEIDESFPLLDNPDAQDPVEVPEDFELYAVP